MSAEVELAETGSLDRTALYRLSDADGVLLYIGIARNPERRFAQHAAEKALAMNAKEIEGRPLKVSMALEKESRSGRSGSRGFRR